MFAVDFRDCNAVDLRWCTEKYGGNAEDFGGTKKYVSDLIKNDYAMVRFNSHKNDANAQVDQNPINLGILARDPSNPTSWFPRWM